LIMLGPLGRSPKHSSDARSEPAKHASPKREDEDDETTPFPCGRARVPPYLYGHEDEADEAAESGCDAGANKHPSKDG
jgi:hypothetical protein